MEKIFLNFEQAALKWFQKKIRGTHLSSCFFHLSQNYIRKINDLGLRVNYELNGFSAGKIRGSKCHQVLKRTQRKSHTDYCKIEDENWRKKFVEF